MAGNANNFWAKIPLWAWAAVLFGLAFAQYANTLGHDYAWDDAIVIVQNERVQGGITRLPEHFEFRERKFFTDFTGYRPVTMSTFSIDQSIAPMNPAWGHLVNVLLYGLTCVTLFFTLVYLFPGRHPLFAFLVSLLFLVHPVHVEAVANIKSRDEILALLFGLLALQTLFRQLRTGNWGWLPVWSVCLVASIWSKENGYLFVPVLVVGYLLLGEGEWRKKLRGSLGIGVGLVLGVVLIYAVTGSAPGTVTAVNENVFVEDLRLGNSLAVPQEPLDRHANSAHLLWLNVKTFFVPYPLVYYSGYAQIPVLAIGSLAGILSLLFGLGLLGLAGYWSRKRRTADLAFGLWFFLATVVIYLHPFGRYLADTKADRFLFTPSVGLCLLLVAGLYRGLRLDPAAGPAELWTTGKPQSYALLGGLGLVTVVFASLTFSRNTVWKDTFTLFSNDMPRLENCAKAHYYMANVLTPQYEYSKNPAKTKVDIENHLLRAVEIAPESYFSFMELGRFYSRFKEYDKVIAAMQRALQHFPGEPEITLFLGQAEYFKGQYLKAAGHLGQARQRNLSLDTAWELEGRALAKAGKFAEGIAVLQQAIARDPSNPWYHDALSDALFDSGQIAASFVAIERLLELDPENDTWWKKMIGRYQLVGDNDSAARYYQEAMARGVLQ
ncbi:MAG: tetratricopeptide repeat protein [Bacteroidota bacterium]